MSENDCCHRQHVLAINPGGLHTSSDKWHKHYIAGPQELLIVHPGFKCVL